MAAAKGNRYNPKGRPVGAKSKKTLQWEQFAEYCMTEGLEKFSTELNRLEKKEYVTAFLNLLDYFKPKLSRHDQKLSAGAGLSLKSLFEEVNQMAK
jgi:hypothetical protein